VVETKNFHGHAWWYPGLGMFSLKGIFNIQQGVSYSDMKTNDENIWSKLIRLGFIL
jgi:hypothetical protein